jgi:hypothetical protein
VGTLPEKAVEFAQKLGIPVSDFDPTTPGVPSVVYGLILLLVIFVAPQGAAGLVRRFVALTKRFYSRPIQVDTVTPSRRNA